MTENTLPKKRWLIVGAGAIGGLLGVPLSLRGHHVTFLARGRHLAAMQAAGRMTLHRSDGQVQHSSEGSVFTSDLETLPEGSYDVIVLALKMHQIASVAKLLPRLLAPQGVYLATQNGVPWWYFQLNHKAPQHLRDSTVTAVDPDGTLASTIDPNRLLASVVYPAAEIERPGVIRHNYGVRFPLGEPNGEETERARELSGALIDAGFKAPILTDVRAELWLKLWGTVAVNPLSALTHATLGELCDEKLPGRSVVEGVMKEVENIVIAVGEKMRLPLERRVEGARKVGAHKTSMLQDVEAGRAMEVDGVMGAVIEMARKTKQNTPYIDAVYGTIRMLEWVLKEKHAKVPLVTVAGEG